MTAKRKVQSKRVITEFRPNSFDAQFATLHVTIAAQTDAWNRRMDGQDRLLEEICEQTKATNGRVTKLETKSKIDRAWMAGAGVVAAGVGTALFQLLQLFHR